MFIICVVWVSFIQEPIQEKAALVKHPVVVLNRKNSPISNTAAGTTISRGTLSKGCSETFDAVLRVHGGTDSNTVPAAAAAGLVQTLVVKLPKKSLVCIIPERESFHKFTIRRCRNLNTQRQTNFAVFLFISPKGSWVRESTGQFVKHSQ